MKVERDSGLAVDGIDVNVVVIIVGGDGHLRGFDPGPLNQYSQSMQYALVSSVIFCS